MSINLHDKSSHERLLETNECLEDPLASTLRPPEPFDWSCNDVATWLADKGFQEYCQVFLNNHINGQILLKLDKHSLENLVPSLGHRLTILSEIESLRGLKSARHVGEGVVNGINGFTSRVMFGLSHLVSDPLDGVAQEGMRGLVKGLGSGIAGAIVSPVEGVAVLSKQLGDGFRHTPETLFGKVKKDEAIAQDSSLSVSSSKQLNQQQKLTSRSSSYPKISSSSSQENNSHSVSLSPSALAAFPPNSDPPNSASPASGDLSSKIQQMKPFFLKDCGTEKPSHLGEGFIMGLRRFGGSVYDGVTGIITEPLKAGKGKSDSGLALGIAKGLTGAICKPVAGTFDLANQTVEGLINTPMAVAQAMRDGPSIRETPTVKRIMGLKDTATQLLNISSLSSPNPGSDLPISRTEPSQHLPTNE